MTIDLDSLAAQVERPDDDARARVREHLIAVTGAPNAYGRLEDLAIWFASVQGGKTTAPIGAPRVVLFAADHGVAAHDVSVRRPGWTAREVLATLDGTSAAATFAAAVGAPVRIVDIAVDAEPDAFPEHVSRDRIRRASAPVDTADALAPGEAERAFGIGMATADAEIDSGADMLLLGSLGAAATTPAAVLIGALTGMDAAAVIGRGSGIDDATWIRKCATIRDALRRARPVLGDPMRLLGVSGGADFAAMTGFLLQCSIRRTPVLLDDVATAASALVAQRISYRSPDWWLAGHVTPEPGHVKALDRLALEPVLDYRVRDGEAVGALLALPVLRAAVDLVARVHPAP
ncbi:nicotinate-nucleotide--dimethylbenzimidazole phosphoribosyltransferase [Embleya sp. NPDC050493]|uniref:nicotinate-nucleotide--dimethylbenzimidazole phosphoribosyltransferase n=1 Tax=Embleya sp. NPDC050493 TaxID=3363989 RepID=UPI0037B63801